MNKKLFNIPKQLMPFLFICLFSIQMQVSRAQNSVSTSDILKSSFKTSQVLFNEDRTALLSNTNFNMPLIENVEFRTESRDLLLKRQEYTIRISPNSVRAISSHNQINKNRLKEIEIENQIQINLELEKRYYLIIDLIFNERMITLFEEKQDQLNDKLFLLGERVYDTNFDVKDLIETEDDLFDTKLRTSTIKEENNHLKKRIIQLLGSSLDSLQLDNNQLLQVEHILSHNQKDSLESDNLPIKLKKLKLNTLENEMRLNVAKSNQFLDYVQAKYGGKNSFLFNENFSIGLGFNLPFFGNSNEKKGAIYHKKLSEESEILYLANKLKERQRLDQDALNIAIKNYTTLVEQNEQSSVNSIYETYQKIEGVSPLMLLKLKILQHKKKIEILKAEHELYTSYIRSLASKELLFQQPYLNYLSSGLEPIILID